MRRRRAARSGAVRLGALGAAVGSALGAAAGPSSAQLAGRADGPGPAEVLLGHALDLEAAGKPREAVALFRQVLAPTAGDVATDTRLGALLGAERVYAELAQTDSVLPLVAPVLRARPADPTVRTVQLRSLVTLRRDDAARDAYRAWRAAAPGDVAPYREFARLLLAAGRRTAADSVLREAAVLSYGPRGLGGLRDLAPERAQVLAAAGEWAGAAASWRDALAGGGTYSAAAVFSLQSAPDSARASVAGALLAPPAVAPARRTAATLLLGWRRPREAWAALAPLAPDSTARDAWREAAEQLSAADAWGPARDAWTRVFDTAPDGDEGDAGRRAAEAALAAGDASGALALADRTWRRAPAAAGPALTLVRVRALGQLGRAADAERAAGAAGAATDPLDRADLAAAVALAWAAQGDLARARASLAGGGAAAQRTAAAGWLALYAGDLRGARALLRRAGGDDAAAGDRDAALTAMTILSRTRADSSPALGGAFLALARRDSAAAAAALERAAPALADAAPAVLVAAARLHLARGDTAAAEGLWRRVVAEHARAPEAAEAELAWARALLARGDRAGARARLEHLIVTAAESALVPVARRELDALGAGPSS